MASSCIATRRAEVTDLGRLYEIENAAFSGDRLSRRSLARMVAGATSIVIVAAEAGIAIGYAAILLHRQRADARLYSIAVDPLAVSRGIGRQLLDAAEAAAREAGAAGMRLEVRQDNAAATRLYRQAGYYQIGERPGYYADGMSALALRKGFIA